MSDDTRPAPPTPETPPPAAPSLLKQLARLWRSINERKMVQWTIAYVALAYSLQHGVQLTSEAFKWEGVTGVSMLLLALGLPVVVTVAWYHGERGRQHISGPELTIISTLFVIGTLLFVLFVRPTGESTAPSVQQASVAAARAASLTQSGAISIAVLPFSNLSSDPEQGFFSDGMTEEIITALAKIPDLRVVARGSAFQYKGEKNDMRAVGQALGATHLIEGSVRKVGDRVRISAQLVRAEDGVNVWANSYDREMTDVFVIQEDIATAIAGALRMPLGLKPGENLVNNRSIDPESYQEYLRAKALVRARGLTRMTDAAALLEKVVAHDPDFAPAWALLAQAYHFTPTYHPARDSGAVEEYGQVVNASLPKAEAAARRAIQLDTNLADGYLALGYVQAVRGKWLMAEELYSEALGLDANNPDALHLSSLMLAEVGRVKEALPMRQKLQAQEPLVPVYNAITALVLWLNGQTDAAIAMFRALPPGGRGEAPLAMISAQAGRYREAADLLLTMPPGAFLPGTVEEAARLLRTAPAQVASPQSLPRLGALAWVFLYVGAPDRALEFYESNLEAGFLLGGIISPLWHPSYAPVRRTERFKAYARASGMVEYWRAKGWPEFCHPTTGDDFACT